MVFTLVEFKIGWLDVENCLKFCVRETSDGWLSRSTCLKRVREHADLRSMFEAVASYKRNKDVFLSMRL